MDFNDKAVAIRHEIYSAELSDKVVQDCIVMLTDQAQSLASAIDTMSDTMDVFRDRLLKLEGVVFRAQNVADCLANGIKPD